MIVGLLTIKVRLWVRICMIVILITSPGFLVFSEVLTFRTFFTKQARTVEDAPKRKIRRPQAKESNILVAEFNQNMPLV